MRESVSMMNIETGLRIAVALQPMNWTTAENIEPIGAFAPYKRESLWTPPPARHSTRRDMWTATPSY
jgi:hypothetical protein